MGKKHNHRNNYYDYEDDHYENGYHDHLAERRRLKRMKAAIKTKNVDRLMEYDDDYDY